MDGGKSQNKNTRKSSTNGESFQYLHEFTAGNAPVFWNGTMDIPAMAFSETLGFDTPNFDGECQCSFISRYGKMLHYSMGYTNEIYDINMVNKPDNNWQQTMLYLVAHST